MRFTLFLAAIAMIAAPAVAGPVLPVTDVRYAYFNPYTKETEPEGNVYGWPVWSAIQSWGYYYPQMSYGPGTTTLDWGDISGWKWIGDFAIGYATDVALPERIRCIVCFFADENGFNSVDRVPLAGFELSDLPTADPAGTWNGWVVYHCDPGYGCFFINGQDIDTFPGRDFGYTY